jgi:hypothetical protein
MGYRPILVLAAQSARSYSPVNRIKYSPRLLQPQAQTPGTKPGHPPPAHLIWSLDLTQISDDQKQLHALFGIIDADGSSGFLGLSKTS